MNYYKEKVETTKKPDPKAEKDEISPDLFKTHESLNELIKRVILLFVPVKYNPEDDNPVKSGQSLIRQIEDASTPEEMIALDLSAGNYLGTLEIPVKRHLGSLADQSFDLIKIKKILIKRISEMAGKYYRNLVENCSPEEKVVLLDLALDSIANVKNRHAIIKLLRRGLIIQGEDSVELMNCSFRAFLLSNYTRHDNEHYRKAIGIKPGKWTGYKYALWLVIVALFIFIFISNQEFLQNLNKMFIALGASIGGITTLLGIMGKKVRES